MEHRRGDEGDPEGVGCGPGVPNCGAPVMGWEILRTSSQYEEK
jgi:hypothetical protein